VTLWGWDTSHYDAVPAGSTVRKEGITFMTHKAGCPGWRNGPFILQLDCEKWNDDSATVPTKAYIQQFCNQLRASTPKLMPIVYAPEWVYGDTLKGLGYPLWASSYVSGSGYASALYPGDSSAKWHAYSGQTPAVLQFTSSATIAGQTTCDANAFRGSITDLISLLAPGWAPTEGTPPVATTPAATLNDADLHKIFYTDGLIPAPANADSADTNPRSPKRSQRSPHRPRRKLACVGRTTQREDARGRISDPAGPRERRTKAQNGPRPIRSGAVLLTGESDETSA
jgi:hypothetical protein